MSGPVSYQLAIMLDQPARLTVGRLGVFDFPAGRYVYTGSARRSLEARIARHLLERDAAQVVRVESDHDGILADVDIPKDLERFTINFQEQP
ncbi:MAG TPA: hypothetical protein PKW44_02185 [Methylophilaceae bacterium]|nr:hypothetical protein [Methylophilaceae bacterium]HQR61117.1 hypothetical protein [Methylophilaceae bacterium]